MIGSTTPSIIRAELKAITTEIVYGDRLAARAKLIDLQKRCQHPGAFIRWAQGESSLYCPDCDKWDFPESEAA